MVQVHRQVLRSLLRHARDVRPLADGPDAPESKQADGDQQDRLWELPKQALAGLGQGDPDHAQAKTDP